MELQLVYHTKCLLIVYSFSYAGLLKHEFLVPPPIDGKTDRD